MKITLLAAGSTRRQRLMKQWGLSILVDDDILFDTFGNPDYLIEQIEGLGVDLLKIRHIVISHDDWDHISGLWKILEVDKSAVVYLCPGTGSDVKERIGRCGGRFVEPDKPVELKSDVYASGELRRESKEITIPEQYLAIKTPKGAVIITGCAHPGVAEIVQHAKMVFDSEIRLLIGGFHLKDNPVALNKSIVARLKKLGVRQVIPLHCTGRGAQKILEEGYGEGCVRMEEGQAIDI